MAVCDHCEGEMTKVNQCKEGINPGASAEAIRLFQDQVENCGDCNVAPGSTHHPGCDMERCGVCGDQAMACSCDPDDLEALTAYWNKRKDNRWVGLPNGYVECLKMGWFCRDLHLDGTLPTPERPRTIGSRHTMRWHDPCKATDPGASPDLNKWARHGRPTGAAIDTLLAGSVGSPNRETS